jgi:hypothetical protein
VKQEGGEPVNWENLQVVWIPFSTYNPLYTFCALGAMHINEHIIRTSVILSYLRNYWTEIDYIWHRGPPQNVRADERRSYRPNTETTSREGTVNRPPPPHGATAPSGRGLPRYLGTTITLRHITRGRTPLGGWSARRDLYLTHNTHKRETAMPPAGVEPTIPASERPLTHALARAATTINRTILLK